MDKDMCDLYLLLMPVLDGYNRTHDVQVSSLDMTVKHPGLGDRQASLVCREYEDNLIDYHYRDLAAEDFDWFKPDDLPIVEREVRRIKADHRRRSQAAHRQGLDPSKLWFNCHKGDAGYFAADRPW